MLTLKSLFKHNVPAICFRFWLLRCKYTAFCDFHQIAPTYEQQSNKQHFIHMCFPTQNVIGFTGLLVSDSIMRCCFLTVGSTAASAGGGTH